MFGKMKVATRLGLGFGTVVILLLLVSVVSIQRPAIAQHVGGHQQSGTRQRPKDDQR